MSSSPDPVRLERAPSAVRLRTEPGAAALDAFLTELRAGAAEQAYTAGREEAARELSGLVSRVAENLERDAEQNAAELSRIAVRLGSAIARELMKLELVAGNHDVERMVRDALGELRPGRDPCEVHVHPEDAERLATVPFGSTVRLVADPALRRGDVAVTSPQGRLVRSLDEGLARITASLAEALESELAS